MKFSAISALMATASAEDTTNHWGIIVAGSRGFGNYRHQADACHAYHILTKAGIPQDQIIQFNYDDAANSAYQKAEHRGKLFNKPTKAGVEGTDVYEGCNIDFKGSNTTAANLLDVMRGDPVEASKKTLGSNADSKIFFYFADHGAPGLVAMPTGGYLYADKLYDTVKYMHENAMYKEMVMYIEACEGGSMFEKFDYKSLDVYALSATNSKVSSWGTYCSPNDKVNGVSVGSCLGDLFSVNWMEDTDNHDKDYKETLLTQYETVKKETTKSPVCEWGDLNIQKESIGAFQSTQDGSVAEGKKKFWHLLKHGAKKFVKDVFDVDEKMAHAKTHSAVDSRDINLHQLYNRVMEENTPEATAALTEALNNRMTVDKRFAELFPVHMEAFNKKDLPVPTDYDCYRTLVDAYENSCGKFDDYSMKYMGVLAAQCEGIKSVEAKADEQAKSVSRINEVCKKF